MAQFLIDIIVIVNMVGIVLSIPLTIWILHSIHALKTQLQVLTGTNQPFLLTQANQVSNPVDTRRTIGFLPPDQGTQ